MVLGPPRPAPLLEAGRGPARGAAAGRIGSSSSSRRSKRNARTTSFLRRCKRRGKPWLRRTMPKPTDSCVPSPVRRGPPSRTSSGSCVSRRWKDCERRLWPNRKARGAGCWIQLRRTGGRTGSPASRRCWASAFHADPEFMRRHPYAERLLQPVDMATFAQGQTLEQLVEQLADLTGVNVRLDQKSSGRRGRRLRRAFSRREVARSTADCRGNPSWRSVWTRAGAPRPVRRLGAGLRENGATNDAGSHGQDLVAERHPSRPAAVRIGLGGRNAGAVDYDTGGSRVASDDGSISRCGSFFHRPNHASLAVDPSVPGPPSAGP